MKSALIVVVISVVMGALLRARRSDAREEGGAFILEYPAVWRWLGGLAFVLPAVIWAIFFSRAHELPAELRPVVGWITAGFFALGGLLTWETVRRRFRITEATLAARGLWGPERELRWSDLTSVEDRPGMQELWLRFGRKKVKISRYLSGHESLAEAIRRYGPSSQRTPEAMQTVLAIADAPRFSEAPVSIARARKRVRPSARHLVDRLRDATGIGFEPLTEVFSPAFLRWVAGWPLVAVVPSGKEGPGRGVEPLLASLLRRDLGLAGAISLPGAEDLPGLDFEKVLARIRAPEPVVFPWSPILGVECGLDAGQLTLTVRILRTDAGAGIDETTVRGPVASLPSLTSELAAAVAERLQLNPTPEARAQWAQGRPRSLDALVRTAEACAREDGAWLYEAIGRGEAHPDAVSITDVEGPLGEALRLRAASADPANAQLCFLYALAIRNGQARDSAASRALLSGLAWQPGHGKSHMLFMGRPLSTPANAQRILAHGEAAVRLLPGNGYPINNLIHQLRTHAPKDPRQGELAAALVEAWPEQPQAYMTALDSFLSLGQSERALAALEAFEAQCAQPTDGFLAGLRADPQLAEAFDRGTKTPLDEARRCRAIVEKRLAAIRGH